LNYYFQGSFARFSGSCWGWEDSLSLY
jgi:hypothetical protein